MRYLPAQIKIEYTKFFVQTQSNVFSQQSSLSLDYGSTGFHIDCSFFDKHNNSIAAFFSDDIFSATLSGNNMVPITLTTTLSTNIVHITLNEQYKDILSRLVISNGYQITLNYILHNEYQYSINFPVSIVGDSSMTDGAGNGLLSVENTLVSDSLITLTAGEMKSFKITL